jgi:hypothetical protein
LESPEHISVGLGHTDGAAYCGFRFLESDGTENSLVPAMVVNDDFVLDVQFALGEAAEHMRAARRLQELVNAPLGGLGEFAMLVIRAS